MIDSGEIVPTKISNLIATQFPMFYREQGSQFVSFLQAYYSWMEEDENALYYSRRYRDIKDIDRTLDKFILHFKEKYLKNIQLTTKSDTRLLVKHALDIYRSKGTERCVQLLFQLVYNEPVRFYYPSQDLFKLSDGFWQIPLYLELNLSEFNVNLVNKSVVGMNSGARAFVEDVVRKMVKNRLRDIAYISALIGDFVTGEKITLVDNSLDQSDSPYVVGSLTEIEITPPGAGVNYSIGDLINIQSTYGEGGIARVANTTDQFGVVSFSLSDGGYGFTVNSDVHISNSSLQIANLQSSNLSLFTYFNFGKVITQPLALLNYRSATGDLAEGESITTYFANNSVRGLGVILEDTQINSTSGTILASVVSGNLDNTFYTSLNAASANMTASNGYTDVTATGDFIANLNQVILTVSNTSDFILTEKIQQGPASGTLYNILGSNLYINSISGTFKSGILVYGSTSAANSIVDSIGVTLGVVNLNNSFTSANNNYIYANTDNNYISATIIRTDATGSGLSISVSNNFLISESINNPNEVIGDFVGVALNATSFGFPANASANLSTVTISNSFDLSNVTIGKISDIILHGFGQDYTLAPFVVVDESTISKRNKHDPILNLDGSSIFTNGEIVTQTSTGARGTVRSDSNSSILYIQLNRFRSSNNFVVTSNSTTTIIGSQSGLISNISLITTNSHSAVMGRNSIFESNFIEANGTITALDLIDSGYGFVEGEEIDIISIESANDVPGIGIVHLGKQGKGSGYYREKGGWLSDQKKLFDGDYYQNFSYEIISRLMLDKYQDMLYQISHPSGTKMFGKFIHDNKSNLSLSIEKTTISTGNSIGPVTYYIFGI